MTLEEMDHLTGNLISRKCYQREYDDLYIHGKYSKSTPNGDGTWDVWLCDPQNMAKGLGERRLNNITRLLAEKNTATGPMRVLDRERVYEAMPHKAFLQSVDLLGIRKRRRISPEQRAKSIERLRGAKK